MVQLLQGLCVVFILGNAPVVDTRFVLVRPKRTECSSGFTRSARAVVVIAGLHLPPSHKNITTARFHSYQQPWSPLVQRLSQDADVFEFTYSQNVSVTDPAFVGRLCQEVRNLHDVGYSEIELVGFSSGGLIARQLVEDIPDVGVTKVIQVCSPNLGSFWALAHGPDVFIESLTTEARRRYFQARSGKRVPDSVQFVCVVASRMGYGDGIVSVRSQWPADLQAQGVSMWVLHCGHLHTAQSPAGVQLIAELVRDDQPRQNPTPVHSTHLKLPAFLHPSLSRGLAGT